MESQSHRCFPIGLENLGQNICFFNSVLQALFSVDSFREYVLKIEPKSQQQLFMKQLFSMMEQAKTPIETYPLIPSMNLLHYDHKRKEQFDAQECLLHIVNAVFPTNDADDVTEENVFHLSFLQSVFCQNCKKTSERIIPSSLCHIEFPDCFAQNSIANEISKLVDDPHGRPLDNLYNCDTCPFRTHAKESKTLFNISNCLIIQLNLFRYDPITYHSTKIALNLNIETKIENVLLGTLDLQAIIFHHGDAANSGHYTANVKYGESWYSVNDHRVTPIQNDSFYCSVNDDIVPYLLIYNKSNKESVSTSMQSKSTKGESGNMDFQYCNNQSRQNFFTNENPLFLQPSLVNESTKNIISNKSKKCRKERTEELLQQECEQNGVTFLPPNNNETKTQVKKRRRIMRNEIKEKTNIINKTPLLSQPPLVNESTKNSISNNKHKKCQINNKSNKESVSTSMQSKSTKGESVNVDFQHCNNQSRQNFFTNENPLFLQPSLVNESTKNIISNKSKKCRKERTEELLQQECEQNGVTFLPPNNNETKTQVKKRRRIMRNEIKEKTNIINKTPLLSQPPLVNESTKNSISNNKHKKCQKERAEKLLQKECEQNGVTFLPPNDYETSAEIRKRRKIMRDGIKKKTEIVSFKKETPSNNLLHKPIIKITYPNKIANKNYDTKTNSEELLNLPKNNNFKTRKDELEGKCKKYSFSIRRKVDEKKNKAKINNQKSNLILLAYKRLGIKFPKQYSMEKNR